jgi:hypothetical protein
MKKLLLLIKQKFCKHTYIPSTEVGYMVCMDCGKLKKH